MTGRVSFISLCLGFFVAFVLHHTLWEKRPIDIKPPSIRKKLDKKEEKTKVGIKLMQEATAKHKQVRKRHKGKKTIAVSRRLIEQGKKMVGNRGQKIGEFPEITARYRSTLGFSNYVKFIKNIGGRFFIFDEGSKRLVAEIDFDSEKLKAISDLSNLSPRSREITGEPEVYKYTKLAELYYGPSSYSMVLLLPLKVDCFLIAGIEDYLKQVGLASKDFISFDGIYRTQGNVLILEIVSGRLKNGKTKTMHASFNLTEISNT